MSNHPAIAALKARLESERNDLLDAYLHKQVVEMNVTRNAMDNSLVGYRNGHEAATERLMTIVQKAVEMAEAISLMNGNGHAVYDAVDLIQDEAREFLAELEKDLT